MMPARNSEALLVSKNKTVLKIMTRVLAEAAFETTICTDWLRIMELAVERKFALLIFDCPDTHAGIGAMRQANGASKQRAKLILLANAASRTKLDAQLPSDVVVIKPLNIAKARNCLKSFYPHGPAETCGHLCEFRQPETKHSRL
jgi:DNA-binding response OmpR family regulator